MKPFLFIVLFFMSACSESSISPSDQFIQREEVSAFDCINKQADNPPKLSDAQKWIVGKWQLKSIITMVPENQIPNMQAEFLSDGTVFVFLAGKKVYTDAFSIIENKEGNYSSLQLINDNLLSESEYRIVNGTLRICEKEMMVDQGIAFDAPGYLFRKID